MSDKVIAIYCFLADFFQETGVHSSHQYKVSHAVVLTAALIAARYFYGNQAGARLYLQTHYGLDLLDKSTIEDFTAWKLCWKACFTIWLTCSSR
jgi:hypothetical protein